MNKADREAAVAYERFQKWSASWKGQSYNAENLGRLVWSDGNWIFKKQIPLLGKTIEIAIDEGLAPSEYNLDSPPEPAGEWAGRMWSKFCDEWPANRRAESYEALHKFAQNRAKEWLDRPHVVDDPDQVQFIENYRDSFAFFKRDLKLDDVRLCKYARRKYLTMHFDTDFAAGYGLNLFYIVGRKKLKATFGDQLGPN